MKIHPLAQVFPMLSETEMRELADSIQAEGLYEAIVLDTDGVLLDGRNRLAACKLADVQPRFTTYTGDDPASLILARNLHRRQLSQGQRAIIVAQARSVSEHSLRDTAARYGVSLTRLSNAATVLTHAPDLAAQVKHGALGLDAAYTTAQERKAATDTAIAQHAELTAANPLLSEQVRQGKLTLAEAVTELARQQEEDRLRRRVREIDKIRTGDNAPEPTFTQLAEQGTLDWCQVLDRAEQYSQERHAAICHAQEGVHLVLQYMGVIRDLAVRPHSPYAQEILNGLTGDELTLVDRLIALNPSSPTQPTSVSSPA